MFRTLASKRLARTARYIGGGALLFAFLIDPDPTFPLVPESTPTQKIAREYFSDRSTASLLRSLLVYQYCSHPYLVSLTPKLLGLSETLWLQKPMTFLVRHLAFAQFCGGETAEEARKTLEKLGKKGMYGILDLSVEAQQDQELLDADKVASMILEGIREAAKVPGTFVAVKCSALASDSELLKKWSLALQQARWRFEQTVDHQAITQGSAKDWVKVGTDRNHPEKALEEIVSRTIGLREFKELISHYKRLDGSEDKLFKELDRTGRKQLDWIDFLRVFHPAIALKFGVQLTRDGQLEMLQTLQRLNKLCAPGVQIMIDAEQSYLQPAISYLTSALTSQYSHVFETHQLYKRDGPEGLAIAVTDAQRDKRPWSGKLVRGAYLEQERQLAALQDLPSPVWDSKQETDEAYNNSIRWAVGNSGSTMVASHNPESIRLVQGQSVIFGQLLGMGEMLGAQLLRDGAQVAKYVPYGPVAEVVPYLVRRAQENGAVLGANASSDRAAIRRIVRERLGWRNFIR